MANILIVEDEMMNRSMLELTLLQAGHNVACAADGATALAIVQQQPPDLIITDVLMPVMDGFELCRQCKADQALKQVPVILYSSDYVEQQEQQLGLELGACRYLVKPSPPQLLLAAVNEVLA